MRAFAPTPTDDPLPLATTNVPPPSGLPLRASAVAEFDDLLHELNPDAARVSAERLYSLCAWLASLPSSTAQDVLDRRLQRMEEMRAMLGDADWEVDEASRMRLSKLFAYVDRDDDLIPDYEPLLGKLDDVLLVELAWPAFVADADDYRDFSEYRASEHPDGNGGEQRAAWIRDRLAEIALWQHHLRVNDSHYADSGRLSASFHIGG